MSEQDDNLKLAKVLNGLGEANKNLGKYDEALMLFQDSLNLYWQATVKYGIVQPKNLGSLNINIAAVYLENNNPEEALDFYGRAELAFKDNEFQEDKCFLEMLILGLNSIDALLHPKINNVVKAREIIDKVKHEYLEEYAIYPLYYLKYYLGALAASANVYIKEGKPGEAEKEYLEAIKLYEPYQDGTSIID